MAGAAAAADRLSQKVRQPGGSNKDRFA